MLCLLTLLHPSADFIACLDACFTQKRNKTQGGGSHRDPQNQHPSSIFVSEADVKTAEDLVERCRSSRPRHAARAQNSGVEDGYKAGMRVPTSVLNGCNDSFVAADEKREKASTQFFADTGLMALLCRHDRPLWTINMTSAGEKQHYAVALLQRLFEHIPSHMTVGVLYDIGCQLHRSCEKWGFLDEFLPRITFGISVFHAYGHQWPCQVVYHPRKCCGFGLTDGEGCERFWSSLKKLIPGLRVSGVSVLLLFQFLPILTSGSSTIGAYLSLTIKSASLMKRHSMVWATGCTGDGTSASRRKKKRVVH
jgi:Kyakuja-Dileera-Zisupton transposase